MERSDALALALGLADIADDITMARFRARDLHVDTKPDLTPVTEADRAVERALRDRLADHPDHAVLGEEYDDHVPADAEFHWVIDPIDGTKNYVRGVPVWATLIGLEHRGELVLGVVSAPALSMRWWGGPGLGAFRDGEPIAVSDVGELGDAQLSFVWDTAETFHAGGLDDRLLALADRCWRTRGIGDFWQHMLVAEGAFDIAVDPVVARWDIAALIPILEAAGGRWSALDGTRGTAATGFVATNGRLHDAAIGALAPPGPRPA